MAKTKKAAKRVVPVVVEDDDEIDETEMQARLSPDEVEDENKLAEFLESFGGKEYKVRVDQFNAAEKVWEFVDTFPLDGFEPFETCKRFGRGRYRLTFLNEKGKYVKGGQPQIRIAGQAAPATGSPVAPAAEAQDPLKSPVVVMMMTMMEKANQQTSELLKAMLSKPEPAKSSATEVLELMKSVKAMAPEDPMKKVQEALMMRMIEKGLDGGDASPGDKSAWQEIVEGLKDAKELGIFDKIADSLKRQPAPRKNPPPAAPQPEVRVQLPHNPEEPAPVTDSPLTNALRPYAVIFATKASSGVAVADAAAYLVDEFYETVIPLLRKHIGMTKFMSDEGIAEYAAGSAQDAEQVAKLYAFAPELVPHQDWVSQVIAEAVRIMTTPEADNAPSNEAQASA